MALNSAPTKDPAVQGGTAWRLFFFFLFLFSIVLLAYLGLLIGYRPFLNHQINKKEGELTALVAQVSASDQENFIRFYFQLQGLRALLAKHMGGTRVFSILEHDTLPSVYYTNAAVNVAAHDVHLDGVTPTLETLAQQMQAFAKMPEVQDVALSSTKQDKGSVHFQIIVTFKPDVFKI